MLMLGILGWDAFGERNYHFILFGRESFRELCMKIFWINEILQGTENLHSLELVRWYVCVCAAGVLIKKCNLKVQYTKKMNVFVFYLFAKQETKYQLHTKLHCCMKCLASLMPLSLLLGIPLVFVCLLCNHLREQSWFMSLQKVFEN